MGLLDKVSRLIDKLKSIINSILSRIRNALSGAVSTLTTKITTHIATLVSSVKSMLRGILASVENVLVSLVDFIKNKLRDVYNTLRNVVTDVVSSISGVVRDTVRTISDFVHDLLADFSRGFFQVIERIDETLEGVAIKLGDLLDRAIAKLSDLYQTIASKVNMVFEDVMSRFKGVTEFVVEKVSDFIRVNVEKLKVVFDKVQITISETIENALEKFTAVAESVTKTVGTAVENIGFVLRAIEKEVAPTLDTILDVMKSPFGIIDSEAARAVMKENQNLHKSMFWRMATDLGDIEQIESNLAALDQEQTVMGGLFSGLLVMLANVLMTVSLVTSANGARQNDFHNQMWFNNPNVVLSPGETAAFSVRGDLNYEWAQKEAQRSGINEDRFKIMVDASKTRIDIDRLGAAFHRGDITEEGFRHQLLRLGYPEGDVETLVRLSYQRPPTQDLITMSVRDVFSPEVVSRFELDEDLPSEFVKQAKLNGLTEEWAERYWASHWRLPSANQGFEMFHRNVINDKDLDLLLKALDVTPFWRNRLKAIAYNPVTRVDVRRMFNIGVIDRDEVYRRYLDIGYNPKDAELMTKFTETLKTGEIEEPELDERELSRTQIKKLLFMGTITVDEAIQHMEDLDYTFELARILVQSWLDERDILDREDMINRVVRRALKQQLSLVEVEQLLVGIQLTNGERQRIDFLIETNQSGRDSFPSKAELLRMYSAGIISVDEWRKNMARHGYNDVWIERYAKLYGVGQNG